MIDLAVRPHGTHLAPATRRLLGRLTGPLSGLATTIGFVGRGAGEARLVIAGGEMTGVHVLRGQPPPAAGAYHIGGAGFTYDEALIRTLGETVERYASFLTATVRTRSVRQARCAELVGGGARVIAPRGLRWFTEAQLARPGFPFQSITADTSVGWTAARSLITGAESWLPGQEAFPGYLGQRGEPRYVSGVTTGSAAHSRLDAALRNGLLELVQIDAAMGHWYGHATAVRLRSSPRTHVVERAIRRRLPPGAELPRLYWLPSADLPGFAVACLIESPRPPLLGVGLGCDLRLDAALGKAFLEAVAVAQLAKVILFRNRLQGRRPDPGALYDLDQNVAYYATEHRPLLAARFPPADAVDAEDLPPEQSGSPREDVAELVRAFAATGKDLALIDLTTADVRELGMWALRVWSPDVLTLSLPSAPPMAHDRFAAYGGARDDGPHPYP